MTTTPPEAPAGQPTGSPSGNRPDEGPRVTRDEIRDLGRLRRSASDRKVAGVAGGLGRHLDIDPLVLRVAFVVLAFFGGAGLILYGASWLLVPDEETERAPVTLDERSRTIALMVVGVLAVFALLGDSWGYFWFPWPVAIIAVLVLIFLTRKDHRHAAPPPEGASTSSAGGYPDVSHPAASRAPTTSAGGYPTYAAGQTPTYLPPARPTAPRDPRRRGPKLFWFTIALVTLAIGLLGMADVAGLDVADSAYPALAVGIIGVMLLVGAFFGRAGGLILLGLLATIGLAGATAADNFESDTTRVAPQLSTSVQDGYDFGAGELTLDLTQVTDPENLDGRRLHLEGGIGSIEVIVPEDMTVEVDAQIGGPGDIRLFSDVYGEGIDTSRSTVHEGAPGAPYLYLDVELGVGEINVRTEK